MFAVVKGTKRFSFPFMYIARIETDLSRHEAVVHVLEYQLRISAVERETQLAAWRSSQQARSADLEAAKRRADAASLRTDTVEPQTLGALVAHFESHAVLTIEETGGVKLDLQKAKKKGAGSESGKEQPSGDSDGDGIDDGIDDSDFLIPES